MKRMEETRAALMEAVEIYREKIKKKPRIYIKEFSFFNSEKSKHNKDNLVKNWSK